MRDVNAWKLGCVGLCSLPGATLSLGHGPGNGGRCALVEGLLSGSWAKRRKRRCLGACAGLRHCCADSQPRPLRHLLQDHGVHPLCLRAGLEEVLHRGGNQRRCLGADGPVGRRLRLGGGARSIVGLHRDALGPGPVVCYQGVSLVELLDQRGRLLLVGTQH